jgi:hypothetical protein
MEPMRLYWRGQSQEVGGVTALLATAWLSLAC